MNFPFFQLETFKGASRQPLSQRVGLQDPCHVWTHGPSAPCCQLTTGCFYLCSLLGKPCVMPRTSQRGKKPSVVLPPLPWNVEQYSSLDLQHFLEAVFSFQDCWFWLICHISPRHTSPVLCVNLQQHILDSCKLRHPPAPIRLIETPSSFFSFLCWPQLTSAVKSCLPCCLPACVHMVCRTWMHQTTSQHCCFLLPVFFILSVETIKGRKPLLIKFTQLLSLQMKSWHHNRDFGPWLPPLQSALKEDNAFPERGKP